MSAKKLTLEEIQQKLAYCSGSEDYYKGMGITYTDGIKMLADLAQAHWLIDLVGSYQGERIHGGRVRNIPFQSWTLTVKDGVGEIVMREDRNLAIVVSQHIPFTDFPDGCINIWVENGVLLLPSEH